MTLCFTEYLFLCIDGAVLVVVSSAALYIVSSTQPDHVLLRIALADFLCDFYDRPLCYLPFA